MNHVFDVAVIGGGINGCATAADAALRGLSVVLLEKDDLASKTSSSSTKLIHGGLRYLEYCEFGLVKKALDERQRLLQLAPHLVHQQEFVLPYQKHMRPAWLLRLGLFLYDHLSWNNRLPKFQTIHRNQAKAPFAPLKKEITQAFSFYDAATDDARLTIMNCLQAKDHGACIRPHSKVIRTEVVNHLWQLTVAPKFGATYTLSAKTLINAAGPWVGNIAQMSRVSNPKEITLVKGSHLIVPKLYEGTQGYLLQHLDKRVVFVIPYHGFSMIGTTDVAFDDSLEKIHVSDEEVDYLTALVNSYFKSKVAASDIVYSWSGVRPLLAEKSTNLSAISRDYYFELNTKPAPIISIYSGKITTYRQLAEEVVNQLIPIFPKINRSKTDVTPLPGATFGAMNFSQYQNYAKEQYSWLKPELLDRYLFTYGSRMENFLSSCTNYKSMGRRFGASLYQVEVDYLVQEEWAKDCDDILKRRTKLILEMDLDSQNELSDYLINCN